MTVSIALVCEAPADRLTITTLAERVIREAAPWIEPETIGDYVEWRGFRRLDSSLKWSHLKTLAREHSLIVSFRGPPPRHPFSHHALRAIRLLAVTPDRADAIVMVHDSDGDSERLGALEQARDSAKEAMPIVIGLAQTKRESWHICRFEPENDTEHRVLTELRAELGFDVRIRSEELTAKHRETTDKRSAKRVLTKLCGDDPTRESRCLTALPIELLKRRGESNGLASFLDEVSKQLIPLFAHSPPEGP